AELTKGDPINLEGDNGFATRVDAVIAALLKRSRGYGSLERVIDTVDLLRSSVDASTLPANSLHVWAATLRTGSMAAQRFNDPRWYEWFEESWRLAIKLEDFDVLHDLCGDLSALQPNQDAKPISDLRARGAIAGFALANAAGNQTKQLKALARNTDRLLWTGDVQAASNTLKQHNVRNRLKVADMPLSDYCLIIDSLCAVAVATGELDEALRLAIEFKEHSSELPIYQAHAYFHIGMIAVRRFNFAKARFCMDKLDELSLVLGSVDAAEQMRAELRNAYNTGRTPEPIKQANPTTSTQDATALAKLAKGIDDAVVRHQPSLAKIIPRFSRKLAQ
ncbi:MAG: hypothetical protein AAF499_15045, partial [Pseudomonadota bacterium]